VRDWEQEAEAERSPLWRRVLLWLGAAIGAAAVGYVLWTFFDGSPQPQQRQVVNTVTRVQLPPPPPPPPPPPKADPPPEPAQPRLREPERPLERVEPQRTPPPPGPAPAPLGLPEGPGGSNAYGLGAGGDGTIGGGGGLGGTGGGGSRFGGYAASVQSAVQTALQRDERARRGSWRLPVRIWVSADGQVTRLQLVGTTGDAGRDAAVQQALTGLRVPPPPADMPQPIVLRINARAS
jgi:TonB family protein